ncbi:transcriptional regulatory protein LysR family [Azotobacter vinelandii CA]|uniref:Transcriptional regulatory protein LysR family n=2 Tax=Azotobacter vinelandii TaxID=354 RepID=C1DEZ3_AZOVD|nr:transcriptional regulatory protein LysR family [Azotobacter vinelandii DJ]AGK16031.1 transcriptional regulatory protein LysR family [Azotobacter vinelandii CA]AGK21848.1 transcriptional regulatory protein LysR family [Azotobacter vinelandii CA6]GLK60246.1 hypothetical protein GCM10017624_24060 [Azotobacter vinelandii]SFY27740.1 LysR substrate binding domain-containing protein [Azotobacter vinelandii]
MPAEHPLAARKSIRFEEVLDHEFVGPHLESSVHALLTREAEALGKPLKLRVRISSFDCMCRLVSAGMGLAVLPRSVARQYLRSHRLRMVTPDEPWARRSLLMVFRKYDAASPTLRTLIDHLCR